MRGTKAMYRENAYWGGMLPRRQLSRRRLLGSTTAGSVGLAGIILGGCAGTKSNRSPGPRSAGNAATSPPQPGGVYNAVAQGGALLDPQATAGNTTMDVVGGVTSRLLRYKASADPLYIDNHYLENDLATS
jgi:hypothetical protein